MKREIRQAFSAVLDKNLLPQMSSFNSASLNIPKSDKPTNLEQTLPYRSKQFDESLPLLQQTSPRVGGSVMVYQIRFRPPFTWTYNCFCDCEENTLYVPRVPGQQVNFTQANKYVRNQLREAVSEAFDLLQVRPQGLIVTTSFWSYPAFIINDINIVKANYIKGKYFYTLANNALYLRCRATDSSTCINKANYKPFNERATLTVDVLNSLSEDQKKLLGEMIQQALEHQHVAFISPIQLL
ncbi:unnamed protein product [Thelazia callipaeda]|uniref:Curli production assembly/transport component CsgE n=1 Tax=Thelazia callipaeda TaxID=103827 RepID=A0A0N5D9A9_THECL|nr:unnamed protein product [Thelazia callipaeda]